MCGSECPEKNMYVAGTCVEAIAENCKGDKVFTGKECITCDPEKGLAYLNGACVCDTAKYLTLADDGTCTACVSPLLTYDAIVGQCYCANGASLTVVDGEIHCDGTCESGVYDFAQPQVCMDSCPSGMVLHSDSGHMRCETCSDYVYYDTVTGTSCIDYMGCVKLGMEPRVVYESTGSLAVCTEGAIHTEYMVDGENLENVRGMAVATFGDTRYYFVLSQGKVQVSDKGFNGEAVKTFDLEDVVSIGQYQARITVKKEGAEEDSAPSEQYQNTVFVLQLSGVLSRVVYDGEFALDKVAENVVYADGSIDFGLHILKDGAVVCNSEADLCPTEDLTGLVHEVQSANREGITLQLKSGALYYRVKDDWVEDRSAIEAGIYEGLLYQLFKSGMLMIDGEPKEMHIKHLVFTDDGVIMVKEDTEATGARRLRASNQVEETGSYFRSPLTVEYTDTIQLSDNGCQSGQLNEDGVCVYSCSGYISDDGAHCYTTLGEHMVVESGRFLNCSAGFKLSGSECVCSNGTVSFDGKRCMSEAKCGSNQKVLDGRCVCDDDSLHSVEHVRCVRADSCARVVAINGTDFCLESGICNDMGMKISNEDGRCVTGCPHWMETDDRQDYMCVDQCPKWYADKDGLCVSQKRSKNIAIIVPVVCVAVVAIVLAVIFFVKKMGRKNNTKTTSREATVVCA